MDGVWMYVSVRLPKLWCSPAKLVLPKGPEVNPKAKEEASVRPAELQASVSSQRGPDRTERWSSTCLETKFWSRSGHSETCTLPGGTPQAQRTGKVEYFVSLQMCYKLCSISTTIKQCTEQTWLIWGEETESCFIIKHSLPLSLWSLGAE